VVAISNKLKLLSPQPGESPVAWWMVHPPFIAAMTDDLGLQKPRKPLGFKSAIAGQFAGKGKTIRREGPPTNLGVRSSNLFGRASQPPDIIKLSPPTTVVMLFGSGAE
jgi:hypothetical protein